MFDVPKAEKRDPSQLRNCGKLRCPELTCQGAVISTQGAVTPAKLPARLGGVDAGVGERVGL